MSRIPKNLSLEPEVIERGERYSKINGTNLSRLVSDFLRSLPLEPVAAHELSPVVRRLLGVAKGGKSDREAYREHLHKKYGGR